VTSSVHWPMWVVDAEGRRTGDAIFDLAP